MPTLVYEIPDISCAHCKQAIEESVADVDGVTKVAVDIDARRAVVDGSASSERVGAAITAAGYEVASVEEAIDLT